MSEQQKNDVNDNTIPLQEAVDITTNWRNYIAPLSPTGDYIRAFYIPISDIDDLATRFPNAEAVRAYICLGIPGDPSSAKLAIVPVGEHGNDILYQEESSQASTDEALPKPQSAIYDFTQPCPSSCDIESPLYTGD